MSSNRTADMVLFNAEIWPGFGMAPAQAIAISGNRVQALGTTEDMLALAGPTTKRVDLGGRFVMPGLNDAHLHLIQTGLRLAEVDVSPEAAPTRQAMLDALRHRAEQTPKGDWVLAQGFDQTRYPDHHMPTLAELDAGPEDGKPRSYQIKLNSALTPVPGLPGVLR